MFFKKKKTEKEVTVENLEAGKKTDNSKYALTGNFPHIYLSYILIFVLALLVLQGFVINSKTSNQSEHLYKYVQIQEQRIQHLEFENQKNLDANDEEISKKEDKPVINNYFYGQSPYSQNQPNFDSTQ